MVKRDIVVVELHVEGCSTSLDRRGGVIIESESQGTKGFAEGFFLLLLKEGRWDFN